jgi:hypothetical protein
MIGKKKRRKLPVGFFFGKNAPSILVVGLLYKSLFVVSK